MGTRGQCQLCPVYLPAAVTYRSKLRVMYILCSGFLTFINPLDPIEISENPSEILGKCPFLTKYGFFHNNLFNIEYLSLQVTYILISIELPTQWYRTRPYILHTFY